MLFRLLLLLLLLLLFVFVAVVTLRLNNYPVRLKTGSNLDRGAFTDIFFYLAQKSLPTCAFEEIWFRLIKQTNNKNVYYMNGWRSERVLQFESLNKSLPNYLLSVLQIMQFDLLIKLLRCFQKQSAER